MKLREELDEQELLQQKLASNLAAEALNKMEQENVTLRSSLEEVKADAKNYKEQLKKLEKEIKDRDLEIKHYKQLADEFNE